MQRIIEALSNLTRSWFLTLWSGPWWHERLATALAHATLRMTLKYMYRIRKTSSSGYGPLINPPPSLRKISYKYNSMLTYIPVSFLFSFKKWFGLGLKIGLG